MTDLADGQDKPLMERLETFMNVKWPGAGPGNPVSTSVKSAHVIEWFKQECDRRGWNCTYDPVAKSFLIVKRYT